MSGISGTCGESLASQLLQQGMERQTSQRLEQQRQLQQERLDPAHITRPDPEVEPARPDHRPTTASEGLKGALLDTYV